MQMIFEKSPSPLKRMASSKNFFAWFCMVLICQWGLIPRRTKSCPVSDPAEQDPVGYQTPRTKSCRVSDSAERWQRCVYFKADTCSVGSDAPQNNVLRGLILCLTKSCGISDPAEQSSAGNHTPGNNFKHEYLNKSETDFKNIFGCEFGDYMGSIRGKKLEGKNLMQLSL